MIAIDLGRQNRLDVDSRAIQQTLDRAGNRAIQLTQIEQEIQQCSLFIEEAKETIFEFSQGIVKVL